jgi:hypothetical protein
MFKSDVSFHLTLLLLLTCIVAVNAPSAAAGADNNDPLSTILDAADRICSTVPTAGE